MAKKEIKAKPMAALFKKIEQEQKGLQKLAKTEKGRKAVKAMGYTEDVDGGMLMQKDYAAMMGGYKETPVKSTGKIPVAKAKHGGKSITQAINDDMNKNKNR